LMERGYTVDDMRKVLNFLKVHENGTFRWRDQIRTLDKLTKKKTGDTTTYMERMLVLADRTQQRPAQQPTDERVPTKAELDYEEERQAAKKRQIQREKEHKAVIAEHKRNPSPVLAELRKKYPSHGQ